jgi:thiamine biosynthesis lipoprotein
MGRNEVTIARRAMACDFSVTLPGETRGAVDAGMEALDEVDRVEELLSVYRPESGLSRLNAAGAAARPEAVDAELYEVLRWAARLSRVCEGAFDPCCHALVRAWGFYRGPKRVPAPEELRAALAASGVRQVEFEDAGRTVRLARPGLGFNLGAFGKGYAIDAAVRRMWARWGVRCGLMQGGQSSLLAVGAPAGQRRGWQVMVEDPGRAGVPLVRVWLRDRALGTSGAANQFFVAGGRRYGHVLDPRSGWPAGGLAGASAIARHAAEADALSTAFFVLGAEGTRRILAARPDWGAVLVHHETTKTGPRVEILGAVEAEVLSL